MYRGLLILVFLANFFSLNSEICKFEISENHLKQEFSLLNGKWNFFKGGGSVASNPDLDISDWKNLQIPFKWSNVDSLKKYKGEIWLRCKIEFQNLQQIKELYLDIGFAKEIDEVFWNGKKIGGMGDFQKKIPDFSERRTYLVPPDLIKESNTVAIHLFGSFWNAGLPDPVKLYFESNFLETKKNYETLALVFNLIYIFSSIFFIFYGIYTKEKKSNLYFGLFSIFLSFYHIILWGYRYEIFNHYLVSYIAELIFLFPLPYFFIGFLTYWLKLEKDKLYYIIKYFSFILMGFAFAGFIIPKNIITPYLHYITYINLINIFLGIVKTILVFFKNSQNTLKESRYIKIGLLLLIPFIVNDALIALDLIHTHRLFVFSYPIFLLAVAISLSDKALQLKREIFEKTNELRKLEKDKLNIIYNISNEFQTIFEVLKHALEKNKDPYPYILKLEYLIQSAEVLDLLENEKYVLTPIKIDIREELDLIIKDVTQQTFEKKKRIQYEFKSEKSELWTDEKLFRLIVFHLLENALLYSTEKINITLDFEQDTCIFKVQDQGMGIPIELQDKIFEKYVRGDTEVPGSGIGLTLVREAVFKMNGIISFETKPNFYTIFEVQLPALRV